MDFSKNSSFAPLDFYKRLTNVLAKRKQLKVDLGTIPGFRDSHKKQRQTFLTNRKICQKIIAKYDDNQAHKQQPNENCEQQRNSHNKGLNFKVANTNVNPSINYKRKKPNCSYLNLSPTFFKAYKGPDLSIFKIPEALPPPHKKPKVDNNKANQSSVTSNFTIASLFSENFKPPQASTPNEKLNQCEIEQQQLNIAKNDKLSFSTMLRQDKELILKAQKEHPEKINEVPSKEFCPKNAADSQVITFPSLPKPFISDPSDILKELDLSKSSENEMLKKSKFREPMNETKFLDFVSKAAKKWDQKSFYGCADPIKTIQQKLVNIHNDACQSPRPSLLSPNTPKTPLPVSKSLAKIPGLPVPVFYEENQKNQKQADENFKNLMNETVDTMRNFNIVSETPAIFKTPTFITITNPQSNNFVDQNKTIVRNNLDINDTGMLFSDNGGKEENRFKFSGFNFDFDLDFFNTTARDLDETPLVSNCNQPEATPFGSIFRSPGQLVCETKNHDVSWLEKSFNAAINVDIDHTKLPISPTPCSTRNSFAIFRSPPKQSTSNEILEQKFARVIKIQQPKTSADFFIDADKSKNNRDNEEWWMKSFNENENALCNLMPDNLLFDVNFF